MNDNEHPITPPPELVSLWMSEDAPWDSDSFGVLTARPSQLRHIAARGAQWGADQELEACCEWVANWAPRWPDGTRPEDELRAARRPKPPTLKEQALGAFSRADKDAITNPLTGEVVALRTILSKEQSDTIRRAIEQLPD